MKRFFLFILFLSVFFDVNVFPELTNNSKDMGTVKNFLIRTNFNAVFLFWELDQPSGKDFVFHVYRTTNLADTNRIFSGKPLKIVKNEYYYIDENVKPGIPYYYMIQVNNEKKILPGTNLNLKPVIFGNLDNEIKVGVEALYRTNITRKEFDSNFIE